MTNLFTKSLLWLSFFFFKFLPCLSLKRILHDYGSHNVDMMDLDKLSKRKLSSLWLSNHFSRPIKGPKRALWWSLLLSSPSSILFHLPSYFICFVYEATKCYGDDQDQFPSDGHFAAVSNGIWDNGAACGRRYRMRCISGPQRPCRNRSIVVEVVDFLSIQPLQSNNGLAIQSLCSHLNPKIWCQDQRWICTVIALCVIFFICRNYHFTNPKKTWIIVPIYSYSYNCRI